MNQPSTYPDGHSMAVAATLACLSGRRSAPRGKAVLEVDSPVVMTLSDPYRPFVGGSRRANYRFGATEAMWILAGRSDVNTLVACNKQMLQFSDDGERLWGAYGPRLMGQMPHVLSSLRRDPDSRQAVVTTWRPMVQQAPPAHPTSNGAMSSAGLVTPLDYEGKLFPVQGWDGASWRSKDTPCTVAWQFQIRDGALELTVFMRSNDVWLGLPYDVLSFTTVQRMVAAALDVRVGRYHHVVGNLHLYDELVEDAKKFVASEARELPSLPEIVLPGHSLWQAEDLSRAAQACLDSPEGYAASSAGLAPYCALIHRRNDLWDGRVSTR